MDKRDKKIRQLEDERNRLMTENQELKYIINDIQSVNDIMREDIEKECAAECGCIVIEGSRTSAAYQDCVILQNKKQLTDSQPLKSMLICQVCRTQ